MDRFRKQFQIVQLFFVRLVAVGEVAQADRKLAARAYEFGVRVFYLLQRSAVAPSVAGEFAVGVMRIRV